MVKQELEAGQSWQSQYADQESGRWPAAAGGNRQGAVQERQAADPG